MNYVHIFCSIAHNHFFLVHFIFTLVKTLSFFCRFMVHTDDALSALCIFNVQHHARNVSYIALYTLLLLLHTHIVRMQNDSYTLRHHMKRLCVPQMCIRRTGNDSFLGSFQHRGWMISMVYMCCVHSMLRRRAVRTHTSFFGSFVPSYVRSVAYLYTLPTTRYMLIASILNRDSGSKLIKQIRLGCIVDRIGCILLRSCCVVHLICEFFQCICVIVNRWNQFKFKSC